MLNICKTLFDIKGWVANLSAEKKRMPIYFHLCHQQIWRSLRCPLSSKWFSPVRPLSLNTSVTVTADEMHNTQEHLLNLRGQSHSPFKLIYFPLTPLYSYTPWWFSIVNPAMTSLTAIKALKTIWTSRTLWPTDRWRRSFERLTDTLGKCFSCISLSLCCASISPPNDKPLFMRIRN